MSESVPTSATGPLVTSEKQIESHLKWVADYEKVRRFSQRITEPLTVEDCAIQSMPDVSPIRWHLAHTTWFFETFMLTKVPGYQVFDRSFTFLFNSYYNSIGLQYPRSKRGLISRPGLQQTYEYRRYVDQAMVDCLSNSILSDEQIKILSIGLNHEQQHQELMLADIKHVFSCNPLDPVYCDQSVQTQPACELSWTAFDEQLVWIGSEGKGFTFDNEQPRHRHFLESFELANRCVTNAEYGEFVQDGGYQRAEFWLSMGWDCVKSQGWTAPLYWSQRDGVWTEFTMGGRKQLNPQQPVCHVSFFEAEAYARWAGCRLPTEHEWEHAVAIRRESTENCGTEHWADTLMDQGNMIAPQVSIPQDQSKPMVDAMGHVWQWTSSQYSAYPGYKPPPGALGEYNGKFMCNQFVLRGGSCATPSGHMRTTYRNFFPPEARWQFSGIRLAR